MALSGLGNNNPKLVIFGGKGGVGKTSCAIATALALSENYKTLIISTDPAHSVSDCLEQQVGFKIVKVAGADNLSAIEVVAEKALSVFKKAIVVPSYTLLAAVTPEIETFIADISAVIIGCVKA